MSRPSSSRRRAALSSPLSLSLPSLVPPPLFSLPPVSVWGFPAARALPLLLPSSPFLLPLACGAFPAARASPPLRRPAGRPRYRPRCGLATGPRRGIGAPVIRTAVAAPRRRRPVPSAAPAAPRRRPVGARPRVSRSHAQIPSDSQRLPTDLSQGDLRGSTVGPLETEGTPNPSHGVPRVAALSRGCTGEGSRGGGVRPPGVPSCPPGWY